MKRVRDEAEIKAEKKSVTQAEGYLLRHNIPPKCAESLKSIMVYFEVPMPVEETRQPGAFSSAIKEIAVSNAHRRTYDNEINVNVTRREMSAAAELLWDTLWYAWFTMDKSRGIAATQAYKLLGPEDINWQLNETTAPPEPKTCERLWTIANQLKAMVDGQDYTHPPSLESTYSCLDYNNDSQNSDQFRIIIEAFNRVLKGRPVELSWQKLCSGTSLDHDDGWFAIAVNEFFNQAQFIYLNGRTRGKEQAAEQRSITWFVKQPSDVSVDLDQNERFRFIGAYKPNRLLSKGFLVNSWFMPLLRTPSRITNPDPCVLRSAYNIVALRRQSDIAAVCPPEFKKYVDGVLHASKTTIKTGEIGLPPINLLTVAMGVINRLKELSCEESSYSNAVTYVVRAFMVPPCVEFDWNSNTNLFEGNDWDEIKTVVFQKGYPSEQAEYVTVENAIKHAYMLSQNIKIGGQWPQMLTSKLDNISVAFSDIYTLNLFETGFGMQNEHAANFGRKLNKRVSVQERLAMDVILANVTSEIREVIFTSSLMKRCRGITTSEGLDVMGDYIFISGLKETSTPKVISLKKRVENEEAVTKQVDRDLEDYITRVLNLWKDTMRPILSSVRLAAVSKMWETSLRNVV